MNRTIAIPEDLARILENTPELRQAYLVGGCVRDALLGAACKDFDIEVFGLTYEQLAGALARWGRTDLVGRSFGVVKLTVGDFTFDFTIPRRDSKVAPGHKGFAVELDAAITPQEAAIRRDFTINALMFDPRERRILDFCGGLSDLEGRILRHTSDAFVEDPLRVLRGMQFAARFVLTPAPETVALSRSIRHSLGELAVERVREEWFKWAEKSVVPSRGLQFLAATGWIDHFPELQAMMGTPQDPEWHPEGDVFVHTCHCCDALAKLPQWQRGSPESRIVYMLAVLTHDMGKPSCTSTREEEGKVRIVSPGHETAGVAIAEKFLERLAAPSSIRGRILPLVANHMVHYQQITERAVRRLANRLHPETIEGLCLVMTADRMGRPPLPPVMPKGATQLLEKARELKLEDRAPRPILMGRHLLQFGMVAGPELGAVLKAAFEAQLEGTFATLPGAYEWVRQQTDLPIPDAVRARLAEAADQAGKGI